MSFSYDPTLSNDISLVRFHVGDKDEKGHYLEDGEISYWLTTKGSVEGAAIACLRYIITQLSRPDFRQDWMSVSNGEARKGYEEILRAKAQEFGISLTTVTAGCTISAPHRADSYENNTEAATEDERYEDPDGLP